jgi:hypothetical protein
MKAKDIEKNVKQIINQSNFKVEKEINLMMKLLKELL